CSIQGRPAVSDTLLLLALATENSELRAQLAEVQEQCIELAVDAGELHAEIKALRRELAERHARSGGRTHSVEGDFEDAAPGVTRPVHDAAADSLRQHVDDE
ncbi:hypothetical protein FV282_23375, partial [Escherichia coli]|uniref:hypothetical protein n=1 Tax=Escherichia coli TaxID=562 RepID=UPI0011CB6BD2